MKVRKKYQSKITGVAIASCLLTGAVTSVQAQDTVFADDFSLDFVNINFRTEARNLVENVDPAKFANGQLQLTIVDIDPTDDERGEFNIQPSGVLQQLESSVTTSSTRPESGRVGYSIQGRFYNSITDGGPAQDDESLDRRYGDVNIYVEVYLYADPSEDHFLYCFENRTADGGFEPAVEGMEDCSTLELVPELNTTYNMMVGIDEEAGQMFVRVNEEEIRIDAPTEMFDVAAPFYLARARVRDGANNAEFSVNSISTNWGSIELAVASEEGRYRTGDFDDFSADTERDKRIVNEQLLLSVSNSDTNSDNDTFLRLANATEYLEAEMLYSSDSDVDLGEGFAAVRISGVFYNEFSSDPEDSNGEVWSSVMLIKNPDGALVGEYCAIRSDAADFSVTTDLADGEDNDRCPTFDLQVEEDTVYKASIDLDQEARALIFTLGNETKVLPINSAIFPRGETVRAQSRIARGATGTVIGLFDNVRNDPAALTDEELAASLTSGGGGGCSIADRSVFDPLLPALVLFASTYLFYRRRKNLVLILRILGRQIF